MDAGGFRALHQSFAAAGADCVCVPMPPALDDVRRVCKAVDVPVNALVAGHFTRYNRQRLADAGVARISLGSAPARVTHKALITSARPVLADGDFASPHRLHRRRRRRPAPDLVWRDGARHPEFGLRSNIAET